MKKPHLKMIPIKDTYYSYIALLHTDFKILNDCINFYIINFYFI